MKLRDHELRNAIASLEARTDLETLNFTQGAVKDILSYLKELKKFRDSPVMKYNDEAVDKLIEGIAKNDENAVCPNECGLEDDDSCNHGLTEEICIKCWEQALGDKPSS